MRAAEGCTVLVIGGYAPSMINFRGPLLAYMRAAGHRVVAAAPKLIEDRAAEDLARFGVECRNVPLQRTGLNPFADLGAVFVLVKLIRRERPDVVLAYTMKPVIYGLIAAAVTRTKRRYALITGLGYAFTEGPTGQRGIIQAISRPLYWLALRNVNKVFFQNKDDAALFREMRLIPAALPTVVLNGSGIDLDLFAPTALPTYPLRFLLIARLLSSKGIREYAEAAAFIRQYNPTVEFHLVGGLDSNPDAISRCEIDTWHANGRVVWHGEVEDVRPYIAACHVFVLPSYREGTPRSVLEAMAMGRPVITTDAPGCRETVINGDNGYLVRPGSAGQLAEAMLRFIEHPESMARMGQRSRKIAEARYDVRKVNAKMLREMELSAT